MRQFDDELDALDRSGLRRTTRGLGSAQGTHVELAGRRILNFSSNDYLGLASHGLIKAAAARAIHIYGTGSGASRLICGGLPPHAELESEVARFLGAEAALGFANGYGAAVGTLGALVGKGDVVIADKLSHACLIDGARLSGATLRVFPHNSVERLGKLLDRALDKVDLKSGRILVVTEAVFSMDGDTADLRGIVERVRDSGALLLVDEAHALGVLGPGGRGLCAELGLEAEVEFRMATLGKAAGAAGGVVAGGGPGIDVIRNRARSFIYSTAPPPAQAASGAEGLRILASDEGDELRRRLRERIGQFKEGLGIPVVDGELLTPIIPVPVGDERAAVALSEKLLKDGILCPAVRYPTVARGVARLRVTLSAAHESDEVEVLVANLRRALAQ